jgi:hypothetical protein
MIILNEKSPNPNQSLEEMAQFKGAGITVEVRSNDRGKLGSPGNPAHAQILDRSGTQKLAEIILTKTPPQKPSDVFYYRTDKVPDGLSKAVIKFAGMPNTKYKSVGLNLANWQAVIAQWVVFHEE